MGICKHKNKSDLKEFSFYSNTLSVIKNLPERERSNFQPV